jgi:hypothetical protein
MNTMIQHSHYMVPSDVQGVPFLKSEHTCKQVVAEGKIAEVTCTESHIARAFSNGEAGAATTLKMKMTLKEAVVEKVAPKPVAFTVPITYDMTKTEREIKDAATFVKAAIAEICATSHAEDKSPERFAKLIKCSGLGFHHSYQASPRNSPPDMHSWKKDFPRCLASCWYHRSCLCHEGYLACW